MDSINFGHISNFSFFKFLAEHGNPILDTAKIDLNDEDKAKIYLKD